MAPTLFKKLGRAFSGWAVYRATLLAVSSAVLLTTPIGNPANGVWHHLVQGRSLLEEGSAAADAPGWLFGLLLYLAHHAFGDVGLVVLRGLLHGLWLAAVAGYLAKFGKKGSPGWQAFFFALIVWLSFEHAFDLHAAAATLPLPVLLLALLETDGKIRWLLPVLTILWLNLDATAVPIVVLIYVAFAAELLARRWRGGIFDELDERLRQQRLATLALGLAAIFATPQGLAIAKWIDPTRNVVESAAPIQVAETTSEVGAGKVLRLSPDGVDPHAIGLALVAIGAIALLGNLIDRTVRLSHALLASGCGLLLAANGALTPSLIVLLVPLIAVKDPPWPKAGRRPLWPRRYPAAAIVAAAALAAPFFLLLQRWHGGGLAFPFAAGELPRGTATFLSRQDPSSSLPLLFPPAEADFWRWTLPALATRAAESMGAQEASERSLFELGSAYVDDDALTRVLNHHSPDFIVVPLTARVFPSLLAAHKEFQPIFFDDFSVLYADLRQHAALAPSALRVADPLALPEIKLAELSAERRRQLRAELERLYGSDPRIARVTGTLAALDVLDGAPAVALQRLRKPLAEQGARQAYLHTAQGDALRARGDLEEALRSYRKAVDLASEGLERQAAQRALAASLALAGDRKGAFRAMERAVGRFNPTATAGDLLTLAELGAAAGESAAAKTYLDFAALQLQPEHASDGTRADLARKIELARLNLGVDR